jgi:hypothetical protein
VAARTPRSLIVTVVVAAVVAASALAGAAIVRSRATGQAAPGTGANPPATSTVGPQGCLIEPCQVLATTSVGGTAVELVADAGAASGRLRVGGPTSGQVIETTITETGVILTTDSLQCIAGGPAACLIKGRHGGGLAGEVVVGRSDSWSALQKPFVSDAGYLALANVDGDAEPEVLAAQHDCANVDPAACAGRPVFVQVFALNGTAQGCTRGYPKVDRLPGYPTVEVTSAQLTPCRR